MNTYKLFLTLFCLYLCALGAVVPGWAQQENTEAKSRTLPQLVQKIIGRFRVPVCFAAYPLTAKDAITIADVEKLENTPEILLQSFEKEKLDLVKTLKQKNPSISRNTVIDYNQKRFNLDFQSIKSVKHILEIIIKEDPRYILKESNGTLLLYPKGTAIVGDTPLNFQLKNASVQESYKKLNDTILIPNQIWLGPGIDIQDLNDIKPINLHLKNVSLIDLLTRFVQTLGSDFGWFLTSVDGQHTLNIYKINPKR